MTAPMAKHTPGPWQGDSAGCEIIGNSRVVATMAWCSGMEAEDEANVRLVKASPDMLDALRGIANFANETITDIAADIQAGDTSPAAQQEIARWSNVLAAIAKATGP